MAISGNTARKMLSAMCRDLRPSPQLAAAMGLVLAHEHGVPSTEFLRVPGTAAALGDVLDRLPDCQDIASPIVADLLLDGIYAQPPRIAAALTGCLYAQMLEDGLPEEETEIFMAAVCSNMPSIENYK